MTSEPEGRDLRRHRGFDANSDEHVIVVAGDWHSDLVHLTDNIPRLIDGGFPAGSSQPTTLLHVGDFNLTNGSRANKQFLLRAAELAAKRQMRILITPGSHDSWARLALRADFTRGEPTRLHGDVWALPRGYRFRIGGKSFLSFGGAGSMSRPTSKEGTTWWRQEMPSDTEVETSISRGHPHVVITHEAPRGGTARVDRKLARFPLKNIADRSYTALGRDRVTRIWHGVAPQLLIHGHHHLQAEGHHDDGRSVYALNQNQQPGNLASIDLDSMRVRWLDSARPRRVE
ncbi:MULTISPECIES: metallophosphoesterase [unclassified Curtobacterium]|uniref:metallophosphoesterase family protein n=1 Tax=unclassified Curtobacterium TaxID=257496 RepID=UPI000F95B5DE|nr:MULTISPECIES: metallophosphoesterase [unclassified Curtobacterium]ROQ16238.1 hypothetical protein EDF41_0914 [Curtobacterium sp. PhB171]ROQ25686.1 hypothetical protein EDF40_2184 [Curtobacterium sp. PhB170]ROS37139.1 hypothetical protein EDF25_1361 [Curtobacterium sp. PhB131]ROS71814.1 hypothetical protein EDF30_1547 [Curtobacterium sp. PhB141]TCL80046.1 hypothetical protein EDF23_102439 [Curtobacterium sp. PhB128]